MSRTAGAVERGDDADLARQRRQRALARLVEQPLGREPLLQADRRRAAARRALGLEVLADDLVLALRVVDADAAARDDAQAVLRLEAQQRSAERNITPLICAPASFSVKYMCPVFHTGSSTARLRPRPRRTAPRAACGCGRELGDGQDAPARHRGLGRGAGAGAPRSEVSGSSNGRSKRVILGLGDSNRLIVDARAPSVCSAPAQGRHPAPSS